MIRQKSSTHLRRSTLPCFTALVLLAGVGLGCNNSSTPRDSSTPRERSDGLKGGVTAATPKIPADESLTSAEYRRMGLPDQDKVWSGDDMLRAQVILAIVARRSYRQLPRYKSTRSGDVFARLTSPQNLDPFKNRKVPLDARISQAQGYFQAVGQVLMLYGVGFLQKDVGDSEAVELMGFQFRVSVVLFELVDEILPTIKNVDPQYRVRMEGLDQIKRGLASVVSSGLQMLTEREAYRGSELVRLVGYMQETFPLIVPRLLPEARTETLLQLEKMQKDPALKDLQPGLGELQSKVKAAVKRVR